jgi:anti-sigma factor RsiW
MIAHLSTEQLAEYVLGRPSPIVERHIQDCPACRAEIANFREALGEFRGAVRAWSQDQARQVLASPAALPERRSWTASQQLAWALLLAAVCLLASFVIPRQGAEGAAGSDAVLLNRVDAQVSRTAPSSMEPLMKLVVEE